MNILLSIVVPSYNAAEYLKVNIPKYFLMDTKFTQKVEIIIVNDGSNDNTIEVAEKLMSQYPNTIVLINKENGGHGSTINTGIQNAKGKYFKVIDADDFVDPKALEKLLHYLDNQTVDMVVSPFVKDNFNENKKTLVEFKGIEAEKIYSADEFLKNIEKVPEMHSIVYLTKILKDINLNLFENCFYVDIQYDVFPMHSINTIAYCDEAVYQYQIGSSQQSVNINSYIKNRLMHERVIDSIIDYRNTYSHNLSDVKLEMIDRLISGLVSIHVDILIKMEDSKKEYGDFIEKIKATHPYSIKNPTGRKMKVLKYIPSLFKLFSAYYQRRMKND